MADPSTIIGALQNTLIGTTQSIKNAELTLEKLQKEANFLPNLLLILRQSSVPLNVRKSAAIYTKKLSKAILQERDYAKTFSISQLILKELSNNQTQILLKRYLAATLQFILMNDQKCLVRQKFNPICLNLMETAKNSDDANINYEYIGLFTQVLMSSFIHMTKQMNSFMQNTLSNFCLLNIKVFKYAVEAVQQQNKDKIIHIFRILKIYSHTVKLYAKKAMLAEMQTVKILYDENLNLLLTSSLGYMLQNNQLSTNIIFYNSGAQAQIIELFHQIKSNYTQCLTSIMRAVFLHFKDKQMIIAHPILSNTNLIPSFVHALNQLLDKIPYYKIKSVALLKLTEEIVTLLIIAVRNVVYYQKFTECKVRIVHGIIVRIFSFSSLDCQTLLDDPDQFINQLIQIIEMESNVRKEDKSDQIEQYSNLRSLAAILLQAFCKHIDGSLPEIVSYSLPVLKSNQPNPQIPKSHLLLMLCILRDQVIDKENQGKQVIITLCEMLKMKPLPKKISEQEDAPLQVYADNIEYLVIMLTATRYLGKVDSIQNIDISVLFQVVKVILTSTQVSDALQIYAYDLIISLCVRCEQLQIKYVQILTALSIIQNKHILKTLQTLSNIVTTTNKSLEPYPGQVVGTVKHMVQLVDEQAQKPKVNQLIINKCWSVITHVCQNPAFIPKLINEIQQVIMPILKHIDGKNCFDFQEDIFMMMSSFIQKSKQVTQKQLIMFEIIPKLFYSQYQFMFGHSFQTLQIFILNGSAILSANPQAIKAIIDMSICNMNTIQVKNSKRNEAQNCDGVLIIQSLIMSCSPAFTNQNWTQITKALTKRLENPPVTTHILQSNILGALALVLAGGYKAFTVEDCDIIMNQILIGHYCFVVPYSIKLAIITLSQLIAMYNLPFIINRFAYLFDTTLTLLEAYTTNKSIFKKNPTTQQERDYDVSISTVTNMVQNMDETQNFKKKVLALKSQNPTLFQKTIASLSEKKAQFLNQMLALTKVNNTLRPIFKIKR